jgi:hypothetical protein
MHHILLDYCLALYCESTYLLCVTLAAHCEQRGQFTDTITSGPYTNISALLPPFESPAPTDSVDTQEKHHRICSTWSSLAGQDGWPWAPGRPTQILTSTWTTLVVLPEATVTESNISVSDITSTSPVDTSVRSTTGVDTGAQSDAVTDSSTVASSSTFQASTDTSIRWTTEVATVAQTSVVPETSTLAASGIFQTFTNTSIDPSVETQYENVTGPATPSESAQISTETSIQPAVETPPVPQTDNVTETAAYSDIEDISTDNSKATNSSTVDAEYTGMSSMPLIMNPYLSLHLSESTSPTSTSNSFKSTSSPMALESQAPLPSVSSLVSSTSPVATDIRNQTLPPSNSPLSTSSSSISEALTATSDTTTSLDPAYTCDPSTSDNCVCANGTCQPLVTVLTPLASAGAQPTSNITSAADTSKDTDTIPVAAIAAPIAISSVIALIIILLVLRRFSPRTWARLNKHAPIDDCFGAIAATGERLRLTRARNRRLRSASQDATTTTSITRRGYRDLENPSSDPEKRIAILGSNGFFASRPVSPPARPENPTAAVPQGLVGRWRQTSEAKLEAAQVRKLRESSSTATFQGRGMDAQDREVLERLRKEELRRVQQERERELFARATTSVGGEGTTLDGSSAGGHAGEGRADSLGYFDLERLRRLS